ncbi:MAG: hypothetical protein ACEQSB_00970 [Undibacterium sp.]
MYSPEQVHQGGEAAVIPEERSREAEMLLENMLQMGWFEERYRRFSHEEMERRLEEIVAAGDETMRERIRLASPDERKEIILEDMILSSTGEGGPERQWFREAFLPSAEGRALLSRFETDPEDAAKEVELLYQKSLH